MDIFSLLIDVLIQSLCFWKTYRLLFLKPCSEIYWRYLDILYALSIRIVLVIIQLYERRNNVGLIVSWSSREHKVETVSIFVFEAISQFLKFVFRVKFIALHSLNLCDFVVDLLDQLVMRQLSVIAHIKLELMQIINMRIIY